jgi:arabinofuranosyltransferase
VILVAVACVVFCTQFAWLPAYEVDDAWISFSYAKNLAAGNGLVFAHGVRTEGYSNFRLSERFDGSASA